MSVLELVMGFLVDKLYGSPLIPNPTGTEEEYHARYHEVFVDTNINKLSRGKKSKSKILGTGAFGEVRLVKDQSTDSGDDNGSDDGSMYAVKLLCKGYSVNDDNNLLGPPNPGVLETEVDILRRLKGKQYNLRMVGVYEGLRYVYLVTELCSGGDLTDFRSTCLKHYYPLEDGAPNNGDNIAPPPALLPADIVREIAVKILHAVNHCQKNGIIHRDIKAANIMMSRTVNPEALHDNEEGDPLKLVDGLRLIDYGSGCVDDPQTKNTEKKNESRRHSTMAGSAFYNSPEMFRRDYTDKTDVWSAGVAIYVFAAGFPQGDRLQPVFDTIQKPPSKGERDLKEGMAPPTSASKEKDILPVTFWDMLDNYLLVYRHGSRPSAGETLESCKFLK